MLLELPAFTKWKRKVYEAAKELSLSPEDMSRVEELFRLFSEHRCRRSDSSYDGLLSWLENAEQEHSNRQFAGIIATQNPRNHTAVLVAEQIGDASTSWACPRGATPKRTPESIATALGGMLKNCRELHLVDPHFGPENKRHSVILEALANLLGHSGVAPDRVRVHCSSKSELSFFEQKAGVMGSSLPHGISFEFVRWRKKPHGQRFHNRYVLTDLGGVMFGDGLDDDDGDGGAQTDDVHLLTRDQYVLRWEQFAKENGTFECIDRPRTVVGSRSRSRRMRGGNPR